MIKILKCNKQQNEIKIRLLNQKKNVKKMKKNCSSCLKINKIMKIY